MKEYLALGLVLVGPSGGVARTALSARGMYPGGDVGRGHLSSPSNAVYSYSAANPAEFEASAGYRS